MKHSRTAVALVALALAATLFGCSSSSNPTAPNATLDTTPPPAPTALAMSYDAPEGGYVLQWAPSTAADLAHYEVYMYSPDPSRDNAYVLIGQPTQAQLVVAAPVTTTDGVFRVKAVDTAGNRSPYSSAYSAQLVSLGPSDGGSQEGIKRR